MSSQTSKKLANWPKTSEEIRFNNELALREISLKPDEIHPVHAAAIAVVVCCCCIVAATYTRGGMESNQSYLHNIKIKTNNKQHLL